MPNIPSNVNLFTKIPSDELSEGSTTIDINPENPIVKGNSIIFYVSPSTFHCYDTSSFRLHITGKLVSRDPSVPLIRRRRRSAAKSKKRKLVEKNVSATLVTDPTDPDDDQDQDQAEDQNQDQDQDDLCRTVRVDPV